MELRRYLSILSAYRWPLILIPAIAALIALGATYVISSRYVGTAVVQLIPAEIEPRTIALRNPDGTDSQAIGLKDPTELLSQSIIESLDSHEVAARVTADLKLSQLPQPQGWDAFKSQARQLLDDAWALLRYGYVTHKPLDQATVDRVGQSLDAQLVRGSYYMEIYASWRDPQTAAAMANAAVQAVLQHSRDVASASAAEQVKYLDAQRQAAKAQVDTARTALLNYSSANRIVSGVSLRSAVNALDQARAALRQNELALLDARKRLSIAKQQNGTIDPNLVTKVTADQAASPPINTTARTISPNPLYQSLQDRVATLAQEVAALETRQGQTASQATAQLDVQLADANQRLATAQQQRSAGGLSKLVEDQLNAQILQLQQQIAALQAQRDASIANLGSQNDLALAEARRRLAEAQQQLAATDPSIESIQQSTTQTEAQTREQITSSPNPVFQSVQRDLLSLEQEISGLEAQQPQLQAALQQSEKDVHDLTISDSRLDALNQDLALASDTYSRRTTDWYNALLEQSRPVAPIRLINPASAPVYPSYPIKIYWALIGLVAGLAVAVALIFVRYNTDLSLRSPAEAEAILELPLLALAPQARAVARKPANGPRRGGTRS